MVLTKDIFGNEYEVHPCKHEDVLVHFQKVREWIPQDEHEAFLNRMHDSIREGKAFHIDHKVFLYYKEQSPKICHGVCMYGKNEPALMIALFAGIFEKIDTQTFKIDFGLHPTKQLLEYKFLLTPQSIRRSASIPGYPMVVRVDKLKAKLEKLYEAKGGYS